MLDGAAAKVFFGYEIEAAADGIAELPRLDVLNATSLRGEICRVRNADSVLLVDRTTEELSNGSVLQLTLPDASLANMLMLTASFMEVEEITAWLLVIEEVKLDQDLEE